MNPVLRGACAARPQAGVALALVVWFIAGMSLLVAGIVYSARTDSRLARLHVERAQATASADGAINLLMADILETGRDQSSGENTPLQGRFSVGEHWVTVVAVPVETLVDLNRASASLLELALRQTVAVRPDAAKPLAQAIVQWRGVTAAVGSWRRFETTEDLLGVEGLNRTTWDSLRAYVAVTKGDRGLRESDNRSLRAMRMLRAVAPAQRGTRPDQLPAPGSLGAAMVSPSQNYRVDALTRMGDRLWLRRRWVSLANGRGGLPWRILRTEAVRVLSSAAPSVSA
ncbi:MAG: general secretion pathway protein K [Halieaceae bacterium]|jgi:general secretion pathway protein K